MPAQPVDEVNYNHIRVWLERAELNGPNCFICKWIAGANRKDGEPIRPLKMGGVEISPEVQIDHMARCVGHPATEVPRLYETS